ncbi:cytoskeleton-associated protein 5-like isoform X1 [Babesia caballi]|uniref:Cytoskeleton-associated protein 5-like isoform X1 n=1 Tax=Babesia caballi TaxID=5871 RepID=A0AAV4LTI6_BABCB|nr:cytoskeleton-associated protein 5-like isoform X1 [Babesia caballi]
MTTTARPRRTLIVRRVARLKLSEEVGRSVLAEGVTELGKGACAARINCVDILLKPPLTTNGIVPHVNGQSNHLLPNVVDQGFKLGLQFLNLIFKAFCSLNFLIIRNLPQHAIKIVLNVGGKSTQRGVITLNRTDIFHRIHDLLNVTTGINPTQLRRNSPKRLLKPVLTLANTPVERRNDRIQIGLEIWNTPQRPKKPRQEPEHPVPQPLQKIVRDRNAIGAYETIIRHGLESDELRQPVCQSIYKGFDIVTILILIKPLTQLLDHIGILSIRTWTGRVTNCTSQQLFNRIS